MGGSPSKTYLSGKHVLITGGSEGIGLALAKECYKSSANVTLMARTTSKLDAAVAAVQSVQTNRIGSVKSCLADVTQADQASSPHRQLVSMCDTLQHQERPLTGMQPTCRLLRLSQAYSTRLEV